MNIVSPTNAMRSDNDAQAATATKRVLQVSVFHPVLVRGGAQQACYELFQALKETDWEPLLLASTERDILPALFKSGATITGFDGRENEFLFLSQGYDHDWHRNRQFLSLPGFESFLQAVRPSVIHMHHFMTYGMEYIAAARNYLNTVDGKLVFTLHEFLSICMARGQMVRTFDNALCDEASSVRCHQCFPDRSPEFFSMRRMWMRHHLDMVDVFVTPTEFLRRRYIDWGLPADKIVTIPNGHRVPAQLAPQSAQVTGKHPRNRFAFFGQLVDNKGLLVVFEAIEILRKRDVGPFSVDVYGANLRYATDQFRAAWEAFWKKEEEEPSQTAPARFHGSYELSDLPMIMTDVDWVLVPSVWWEIFGMVVSEAFMFGKPAIVSNIGGIGERVRDNVDGLHFTVRSARSLADVMERAITEEGLWERLHAGIVPPPTAEQVAAWHIERCYTR